MGNDLTLTADRLLASNPAEAAKQGIAPKGLYTIGDVFAEVKFENENITWYDNLEIDQNEGEVILENIYTSEQFRQQGAGTKLIQALLPKAYDLVLRLYLHKTVF